jgi:hypothetical protein
MQSVYHSSFDREVGCTEAEWLGWLPAAIGDMLWVRDASQVRVEIGEGHLLLTWQTGKPRTIALLQLPRLLVSFRFDGLSEAERYIFMKRFDLYMQRGGG